MGEVEADILDMVEELEEGEAHPDQIQGEVTVVEEIKAISNALIVTS